MQKVVAFAIYTFRLVESYESYHTNRPCKAALIDYLAETFFSGNTKAATGSCSLKKVF